MIPVVSRCRRSRISTTTSALPTMDALRRSLLAETYRQFMFIRLLPFQSYAPEYRTRNYDSLRYGAPETRTAATTTAAADSSFASEYRRREQRDLSPVGYGRREMNAHFREEIHREPLNNDQVVAVSGKHRCAHCSDELGEIPEFLMMHSPY